MKPFAALLLGPLILPLAACGGGDGRDGEAPRNMAANVPASTREADAVVPDTAPNASLPAPIKRSATTDADAVLSCAAERGQAAAQRLVKICTSVSPATHPPCNAVNNCAIIEDEIARSCALIGDDAANTPGCAVDPRSNAAAAAVVRRYYSAINAHDYSTAWTQWGPDGRPGQRFADFQKGFADTRATRVTIGTLPPSEGAAGSTYATIPVTVDAQLNDGRQQRFVGQYVVRRVNDVPGASAAQRQWHIDSAMLKPAKG
ncbi:hypothetical protein SOM26_14965 [Sphingomonas sp. CFBP8993]|uniref:hypothetical protein n=1 Tax=Sphingomonas sp. CFBP8993 TaxID=3096526 RepID=UPI002A6B0178|nr:hypothetical protein [Sphingomonas sp. CFBP8993]MDY0959994.1 hypothetical protein [Sphingomonas sp. CFBP8993]